MILYQPRLINKEDPWSEWFAAWTDEDEWFYTEQEEDRRKT